MGVCIEKCKNCNTEDNDQKGLIPIQHKERTDINNKSSLFNKESESTEEHLKKKINQNNINIIEYKFESKFNVKEFKFKDNGHISSNINYNKLHLIGNKDYFEKHIYFSNYIEKSPNNSFGTISDKK